MVTVKNDRCALYIFILGNPMVIIIVNIYYFESRTEIHLKYHNPFLVDFVHLFKPFHFGRMHLKLINKIGKGKNSLRLKNNLQSTRNQIAYET